MSRIAFWAAVGGNHACAQDEAEPAGRRSRKEVLGQLGRNAYAGPGGLTTGWSESGRLVESSWNLTIKILSRLGPLKWFRDLTFRNACPFFVPNAVKVIGFEQLSGQVCSQKSSATGALPTFRPSHSACFIGAEASKNFTRLLFR